MNILCEWFQDMTDRMIKQLDPSDDWKPGDSRSEGQKDFERQGYTGDPM